jgi:hypothetical protein
VQTIALLIIALIIAGIGFVAGYFVSYILVGILLVLSLLSLFFLKRTNSIADASTPVAMMEITFFLFLVGLVIGFVVELLVSNFSSFSIDWSWFKSLLHR